MKKFLFLFAACALAVVLFKACGPKPPEVGEAFADPINDYAGVTMTVVEGTAMPGGVTVTILNTTDKEIDSGNKHVFALQVRQDGHWYWLETKEDSYATTSEALIYEKDVSATMNFNWASRYGSLAPGHYRVVKSFSEFRGPGDYTNFLLGAEFTLD